MILYRAFKQDEFSRTPRWVIAELEFKVRPNTIRYVSDPVEAIGFRRVIWKPYDNFLFSTAAAADKYCRRRLARDLAQSIVTVREIRKEIARLPAKLRIVSR